jgi:hypothetical protein
MNIIAFNGADKSVFFLKNTVMNTNKYRALWAHGEKLYIISQDLRFSVRIHDAIIEDVYQDMYIQPCAFALEMFMEQPILKDPLPVYIDIAYDMYYDFYKKLMGHVVVEAKPYAKARWDDRAKLKGKNKKLNIQKMLDNIIPHPTKKTFIKVNGHYIDWNLLRMWLIAFKQHGKRYVILNTSCVMSDDAFDTESQMIRVMDTRHKEYGVLMPYTVKKFNDYIIEEV